MLPRKQLAAVRMVVDALNASCQYVFQEDRCVQGGEGTADPREVER